VCPGIRKRLREIPLEQSDLIDSYLAEDAFIRNKRKQLQQTKERLQKVDAILGGSDFGGWGESTHTDLLATDNGLTMSLDQLEEQFRDMDKKPNDAALAKPASASYDSED
jgi:hypothetical protein